MTPSSDSRSPRGAVFGTPATLVAVLWLVMVTGGGCGGGGESGSAPDGAAGSPGDGDRGAPDLVLVVVGGLRAGVFDGAEGAFIEGLGREPTHRFTAAYSQSLAPLTSLVSLVSGRYPSAVPFCGLQARGTIPEERVWCAQLPADRYYLPGVLSAYGYRSALVTAGLPGADVFEGVFEHREPVSEPGQPVPWKQLEKAAAGWWEGAAAKPRLLVIVVADMGLEAHPQLALQEGAPSVEDETGKQHRMIEAAEAVPAYVEVAGGVGRELGAVLDALGDGDRPRWLAATSLHGMSVGERTGTADASDSQIAWQLSHLAHHIILDRTVHVPLALFGPTGGEAAEVVDEPVELVDVYPTFLELAGAAPGAGLPGGNLLGGGANDGGVAYVEFGDMLALRAGDQLLTFRAYVPNHSSLDPAITERLRFESVDAEKYSLCDVVSDPLQIHNRVHHEWAVTLDLRGRIEDTRDGVGAPPSGSMTSGRVRELRLNAREGYW